jgi:hypothetical protein
MCPALPDSDYYDGSAPPGAFSRRCTSPAPALDCAAGGSRHRAVPVFTGDRSISRHPAVPLRPRHEYAVVLPRGLPADAPSAAREFSNPSQEGRIRAAPGPHPPGSSRWGIKGRQHRFLSYTSASRLPDPHHLAVLARPGVVRTAPTLPGTSRIRLSSATLTPLRRGNGAGLPPALGHTAPHGAPGLRPEPRPSSEISLADPLAGHHKGYQPPRTGPRSFGWQGAPPCPRPGRLDGLRLPDEEIRLSQHVRVTRFLINSYPKRPAEAHNVARSLTLRSDDLPNGHVMHAG